MRSHIKGTMGVVAAFLAAGSVFAAEGAGSSAGFKVGGYADGQFQYVSTAATIPGFVVAEGALKTSYTNSGATAFLDVPFTVGTTTLFLGGQKAQAYAGYKFDFGLSFRMGKFDTLYGLEDNDLDANLAMSNNQLQTTSQFPVSHLGAQLTYTMGAIAIDLLVADPRNTNTLPAGTGPDMGVRVGINADAFHGQVGFLYNTVATYGFLVDVVAGYKSGMLGVDFGFDISNPASTLAFGFLLQPALYIGEHFEFFVRGEFVKATPATSAFGLAAGPGWKFTKELKVRANYGYTTNGGHDIRFGAIYSI